MVDYRKFLGKAETLILPFLGGMSVDSRNQRFRLDSEPEGTGWFTFEVKGRVARALDQAEAPELDGLEKVQGHLLGSRLIMAGGRSEEIQLLPEDEPPLFALCSARRWYSDDLIFEVLEFESEAEDAVRIAAEESQPIGDIKGVPATLRAAFGYHLARAVSQEMDIRFRPLEIAKHALAIADEGEPAARRALDELAQAREEARRRREIERTRELARMARAEREVLEVAETERRRVEAERLAAEAQRLSHARRRELDRMGPMRRAELALENAGARLLRARRLGEDQIEVVYRFRGERFESIVHAQTLNVIDAGICLQGSDSMLTLESLPSAIKEAMEVSVLHITRGDGYWD